MLQNEEFGIPCTENDIVRCLACGKLFFAWEFVVSEPTTMVYNAGGRASFCKHGFCPCGDTIAKIFTLGDGSGWVVVETNAQFVEVNITSCMY